VAAERGESPEEAAIDLVIEDRSRVGAIYFMMSEENVEKELARPWVSFGSDEGTPAPEGVFLKRQPHPRAYGNVARVLGTTFGSARSSASRRPCAAHVIAADNLRLDRRGRLAPDYYADLVVFDAATIQDHATYEQPHQYATGVVHVFVNGVQVIAEGSTRARRRGDSCAARVEARSGHALTGSGRGLTPRTAEAVYRYPLRIVEAHECAATGVRSTQRWMPKSAQYRPQVGRLSMCCPVRAFAKSVSPGLCATSMTLPSASARVVHAAEQRVGAREVEFLVPHDVGGRIAQLARNRARGLVPRRPDSTRCGPARSPVHGSACP
jgi:N-acyl-D-amino-acid deacylase